MHIHEMVFLFAFVTSMEVVGRVIEPGLALSA